ncbi:MAG: hypothetical protein ACTSUO_05125 [Candidatus Thorarchaeota archaeon]
MAKSSTDVILRDRMQFDVPAGTRDTLYGRIDLSDYVNTVERKGLAVKEVRFHLRDPLNATADVPNTGVFSFAFANKNPGEASPRTSAVKLFATTRAYEFAKDVGIASPDVLCVEEFVQIIPPELTATPTNQAYSIYHNRYGTPDLHPSGFTVVSDLLIGLAGDGLEQYTDDTVELDVMIIASPVTVTTSRMNEILTQAQDL